MHKGRQGALGAPGYHAAPAGIGAHRSAGLHGGSAKTQKIHCAIFEATHPQS
jgi:hypothetical protein